MRTFISRSAAVAVALGMLATVTPALAADHIEANIATADPVADINDVYVFKSTDAPASPARTVFVMTVLPIADVASRFSDVVQYSFVIEDEAGARTSIVCTADNAATQAITCTDTAGNADTEPLNNVDAGDPANENIRIFAGLRDDPFFFDLEAFNAVLVSGDPTILTDDTGADFFATLNTLALVVEVRNSNLPSGTLRVWGRTVRNAAP